MKISRSDNEILISIPKGVLSLTEVQSFIDLIRYKTIIKKSKATTKNVDSLTSEINSNISRVNLRFLKKGQ